MHRSSTAAVPRRARRVAPVRHGAILPGLSRRVDEDARRSGLHPWAAWALWWFPVLGLVALLAIFAGSRPLFYSVTREDRVLEWGQFAACALTCLLAGAAALRFARRGLIGPAVLMGLFGLGMLGLSGEEISWGQRVIGVITPERLAAVNLQSETNVHNLEVGLQLGDVFKSLEFVICVGGIALALLLRARTAQVHPRLEPLRFLAPPLAAVPAFAAMAGYQVAQGFFFPDSWDAVARLQELAELGMYVGLAVLALGVCREARRPPRARRAGRSARPERMPWVLLGVVLAVTVAFAVLTSLTGVQPGNV